MDAVGPGEIRSAVENSGEPSAGDRIGRYRLLEVVGEGGFGTVWMAEQEEPVRRRVALKVIKLGMDTRQVIGRFEAERQALALMDHPSIARVHDGGATETGRPYFVMELVRGVPLTQYCDRARLNIRERVELLVQVGQAVQHAHQKGIIHRDLKPSNVLVTEQDGKPVPKVIDFGIAKATDVPLTEKTVFTRFNQMMGTPAYMSPEQAGLGSLDVDTRTDIYSLGVLLYELLTGRTPMDPKRLRKTNAETLLKSVREVEAPRPSTCLSTLGAEDLIQVATDRREEPHHLRKTIHGDLDWIALKALEKDRTRRYASAQDLAADLQRYLNNEAIVARPPSNLYRFQKLVRRNKLAFAAAAAVLIALFGGLATTSWQWVRSTQNFRQARLNAYVSEMGLAQQALEANNMGRALDLINLQRPKPGEKEDFRGFEWRHLWELAEDQQTAKLPGNQDAVGFSPDGRLLAVSEKARTTIYEIPSRRVFTNLPPGAVTMAFLPTGGLLAMGGQEFTGGPYETWVELWDTTTWNRIRQLAGGKYPTLFSPDGRWLVTGATNDPPRHILWRTDTWTPVAFCEGTPEFPWQTRYAMAFSPDGSLLVTPRNHTGAGVCTLNVWKVPTLESVATLPPDLYAWSAAFHPDGRHLLIGTFMGELVVWDLQEQRIVQQTKVVTGILTTVCVAPDGSYFVTTGNQGTLIVWDGQPKDGAWRIRRQFRGHKGGIWTCAISPDSRQIVTGGFDQTARLWDFDAPESSNMIKEGGLIAGFTSDSGRLILAPSDHDYRWQLMDLDGRNHSAIAVPTNPPMRLTVVQRPYDAAGSFSLGVLGRADGTVELWDLSGGKLKASWRAHTNEVTVTALSRDGSRLATGDSVGDVKLWDTRTQRELTRLERPARPNNPVAELAFSPDGQTLAGGWWPQHFGDVILWDVETGRQTRSLKGLDGACTTIAFSPDGHWLVGGSGTSAEGCVWSLETDHPPQFLRGHTTGVVGVAFSPDGQTLATGSYDTIKLWKVPLATGHTLQEVASFPTERAVLRGLQFSPDGKTLAAGYLPFTGASTATNTMNNFVRLYHAPSLEEIAAIEASEKARRDEMGSTPGQ